MAFSYETNEVDNLEIFKTHYYKTNYEKLKEAIIEYAKSNNFEVQTWNDEFAEGCISNGKITLTIKIIMQNPRETSIDFFIEVYKFLGGKKQAQEVLQSIYSFLGKKFEFKGLGLHA